MSRATGVILHFRTLGWEVCRSDHSKCPSGTGLRDGEIVC